MSQSGQMRIRYPEELPVSAHRGAILNLLDRHPVVIIAGETGSGKTTQIPKMCLEWLGDQGRVACTQPRRVAALSISRRIAEETGVEWGAEVGAKIRFTDRTSRATRIKVLTDGMLLTEIQGDPDLRQYRVILVDEAHERSLNIDFLLGYLKRLLPRRPDLRVVITSATIDTAAFSRAFDDAPVLEVSGRLYPVETLYAPIDELLEDTGEVTYVDAVVRAVEQVLERNQPGDILVFLPGEKDIREVRDLLEARGLTRLEVLPLFGRLTAEEQDRIFKGGRFRKVILSTNIAETSLTVPGIRFVIDSGLARISRYSAHTHTRRLPIEKIARSSADQRKGRAGRLSEGVCIRLYSESDYASRPEYATPEILRANLADVILRMTAFRIGDIRTFPFVEPPTERAIRSGYELLVQLGALDAEGGLTPLGSQLARLPVDPTVGRMLLEASREGCLSEVLVIAAGLSIQDPRERPMDAAPQADEMHRRFRHEESDFLTLLNIWNTFHDELERLSQNQLRKFCKAHFLSYQRMREWRDIHAQLERVLREMRDFRMNAEPAEYEQVHRALLSGLLSGVAAHHEGNQYKAVRNRTVTVFPGSTLFRKTPRVKKARSKSPPPPPPGGPRWILSAEFMETTRLYARTVARIDPQWILRVGSHVLTHKYTEPFYDEKGERVLVRERILLYGLEVAVRKTGYLRINAKEATEIFIQEALVQGRLRSRPPFLERNLGLLESLRERRTRLRMGSGWELDERLHDFYASRLSGVASLGDLKAFLRDQHGGKETVLEATEADLLPEHSGWRDADAFPDQADLEGVRVRLAYAYRPGEEDDGATLRIPVEAFESVNAERIEWAVPGYVRQRIEHLLRGLPKELRKRLFPLADLAQELALRVDPAAGPLVDQLTRLIGELRKVVIRRGDWSETAVPEHLRPRLEVLDREKRPVAAGRDWERVSQQYQEAVRREGVSGGDLGPLSVWQKGCQRYERAKVSPDDLPDLPLEIHLGDLAGLPVKGYPGLEAEAGSIGLRLFRDPESARAATGPAFAELVGAALGRDLGWFQRDLTREIRRVALGYAFLMDGETLARESFELARRDLLRCPEPLPLNRATLEATVATARSRMRGLAQQLVDQLQEVLDKREAVRTEAGNHPAWQAELGALLHARFLRDLDLGRLQHYPRYLEALRIRIQRARQNPAKDVEKARPVIEAIREYQSLRLPASRRRSLRWLLEEFKVQAFAQELGTATRVSPKIVEQALREAAAHAGRKL